MIDDPAVLQQPVDEASYDAVTAPLWAYLDALTPILWRQGKAYPANEPALGQLLADGEIDLSFAFNPGRASAAIAAGELHDTVRTSVWDGGTIGNASFVAIPYNAAHAAGAMVIANLLLEPEVQARAQDPVGARVPDGAGPECAARGGAGTVRRAGPRRGDAAARRRSGRCCWSRMPAGWCGSRRTG